MRAQEIVDYQENVILMTIVPIKQNVTTITVSTLARSLLPVVKMPNV